MRKCIPILFLLIAFECYAQTPEIILPEGHHAAVYDGTFSADSKLILTRATDGSVMLWSTATGKLIKNFNTGTDWVRNGLFTADSKKLILSKASGIEILNTSDLTTIAKIAYPGKMVYSTTASRDGNWLIGLSDAYTIKILNLSTGKWTGDLHHKGAFISDLLDDNYLPIGKLYKGQITSLNITPDGKTIIAATKEGDCKFWDVASRKIIDSVNVGYPVTAINISPLGKKAAIYTTYIIPYILDIATRKFIKLEGHGYPIVDGVFSKDEKLFASTAADGNAALLWNVVTGKEVSGFTDWQGYLASTPGMDFNSNSSRLLTSSPYYFACIWEIATKKILFKLDGHKGNITTAQYSPNGRFILTTSEDHTAKLWDAAKGRLLFTFQPHNLPVQHISLNSGNQIFSAVSAQTHLATIWDFKKGRIDNSFKLDSWCGSYFYTSITPDDGDLYINECEDIHSLYNLASGKHTLVEPDSLYKYKYQPVCKYRVWEYGKDDKIEIFNDTILQSTLDINRFEFKSCRISNDCSTGLVFTSSAIRVYNLPTGKLLYTLDSSNQYSDASYSHDQKYIVAATPTGTMVMFNAATGKQVHTFQSHTGAILQTVFLPGENKFLTSSNDGTIKYWNIDSGKLIATFIPIDSSDYMILLPNNIYMASKKATRLISFRTGNKVFSFDQFDILFNKPHEVLQALGCTDASLIDAYKKAYEKRLKKGGVNNVKAGSEFNAPDISIANADKIPTTTITPEIKIQLTASDSTSFIKSYRVYVNDVPLNGSEGFVVNNKKKRSDTSLLVTLSAGFNKIQVYASNDEGIESPKLSLFVYYEPKVQPVSKLYFVGIGINEYLDSTMNLHYAAKDIRDLSMLFSERSKNFIIDTLINKNATRQKILEIHKLLSHSSVEDKVIISISGHGLLSKDLDFYFANHDIDFSNPEKNGVLYDELEALLDNIPARKKLLLIDACHSGEVDKDEAVFVTGNRMVASDSLVTIKSFKTRGVISPDEEFTSNKQNSFDLMKLLFSDLNRGNGTVVISAAGGKEYALEDKTWDNGVFTFCTKKAIIEKLADTDNDGITVNELNEYIRKAVEQYTNGKQKPTTRRELSESDWLIF